jgi:hypothetical protein
MLRKLLVSTLGVLALALSPACVVGEGEIVDEDVVGDLDEDGLGGGDLGDAEGVDDPEPQDGTEETLPGTVGFPPWIHYWYANPSSVKRGADLYFYWSSQEAYACMTNIPGATSLNLPTKYSGGRYNTAGTAPGTYNVRLSCAGGGWLTTAWTQVRVY